MTTPPSPSPPPEKPQPDMMRLLPAMVVGMGVLLVIGMVVFVVVAYKKFFSGSDPALAQGVAELSSTLSSLSVSSSSSSVSGGGRGAAGRAPLETALDLPDGSKIDQLLVVNNRVVALVRSGGGDRLVVLDPGNGAVLGVVTTGKRAVPPGSPAPAVPAPVAPPTR